MEDGAVVRLERGAHQEAGIRRIGAFTCFAGFVYQMFVFHYASASGSGIRGFLIRSLVYSITPYTVGGTVVAVAASVNAA
jgi:hypothetical protein